MSTSQTISTPSVASSPSPTESASDPFRIGLQIVAFEANPKDTTRRTPEGFLKVVGLPANDGGGSWEIAGINEYHAAERARLLAMRPEDRERSAAAYIEAFTREACGIKSTSTLRQGTALFVLDCVFNRGGLGSCDITQKALVRLGFSMKTMGGRGWGPKTRAALEVADKRHASRLIPLLRAARAQYENERDRREGARPNLRPGLVNRWNACASIATAWNAEPQVDKKTPKTIALPRESNSALNSFYGTASKSGSYLARFNFPVANVRLYTRDGVEIPDRDGDGRDDHSCHKDVVAAIEAALLEIFETLGREEFERQGWHIFGGAFNYRLKTGGSELSTHSWAIAFDFNPAANGWKQYSTTFSDVAFDIMEKHGFLSAFRAWGHDAMHFQKAIPVISKGSYYDRNGLPAHIVAA